MKEFIWNIGNEDHGGTIKNGAVEEMFTVTADFAKEHGISLGEATAIIRNTMLLRGISSLNYTLEDIAHQMEASFDDPMYNSASLYEVIEGGLEDISANLTRIALNVANVG